MKIAIVVPGRFHAFDLARELLRAGHDVTLFTDDPRRITVKFGVPPERSRHLLSHGLALRAAVRVPGAMGPLEPALHRWFGGWAAREVSREKWDVVHAFSGVAEEILRLDRGVARLRSLVRGSAHVRVQARILEEEERRAGRHIDRPSGWMIRREEREYALADRIVVLSSFARASFAECGVPAGKILTVPMGTELARFRARPEAVAERRRRILSGAPLRVITTGNFSFQKGAFDFARLAGMASGRFEFRWVGSVLPEARALARSAAADFRPFQEQSTLPEQYAWADLFLFPTLHDGFPAVLAQALASGLPALATPNSSAPDLVAEGRSGWIVPIRSAEAILARLDWCDKNRPALAEMAAGVSEGFSPRDWSAAAREFAERLEDAVREKEASHA